MEEYCKGLSRNQYNRAYRQANKDNPRYREVRRELTRRWRHRQKANAVIELGGKCVRCGWNEHIFGLEFDHINPSTKKRTPSTYMCGVGKGKFLSYVKENCQILCANCHALKTVAFSDNIVEEKICGDMTIEKKLFESPMMWPSNNNLSTCGAELLRRPIDKKETSRKLSSANKGRPCHENTKIAASKSSQERWKNPEYRARMLEALRRGRAARKCWSRLGIPPKG